MVETNPFKIEEAKWTPKNVYEILPPNAISYTGYDFSEGSTDFDQDETRSSLLDGFLDFFGGLLKGIGAIIGGAIDIGGAILSPIINGIGNLIKGIANAIGSIFGGGSSTSPPPPLFNPIKTNLEAAIQPHLEQIKESKKAIEKAQAEQLLIREQIREQSVILDDALERAEKGITDAEVARKEAVEAVGKADAAVVKLENYNTALKEEIRVEFGKAMTKAEEAITEAKASNTKLEEISDSMEAGFESANSAIDAAKTLTQQVKAIADKNKADVADALSKADKANADLSALSPKVTKNQADVAKAIDDIGTVNDGLKKAQGDATKALADISSANAKITNAQSDATKAFTEAGKVRSEVTPKIEAAQTKGTEALAVADKAVDWLRNPNEIGASLIAIDPETGKPNWAEKLEPVPAEENPDNLPGAYRIILNSGSNSARNMWVNIDPTTEYMVSLWVKADKRGSDMTYDIRDQDNALAFKSSRPVEGFLNAGNSARPCWIMDLPTEWTQYKAIVTPSDSARKVRFAAAYFNHSNGSVRDAVQYIADFQIYPLVPSQADVDQAQNDAIKANSDILVQQGLINDAQNKINEHSEIFRTKQSQWNKAVTDSLATQKLVNDHQAKWNGAATNALDALKKFNDNQIKWNTASTNATSALQDATTALARIAGISIGGRNLLRNSDVKYSGTTYLAARILLGDYKPADEEEVTLSLKGQLGSDVSYFTVYNTNGNGPSRMDTLDMKPENRGVDGVYRSTGKWVSTAGNVALNIYAYPSSSKQKSTIEWVKLEKGNQATDWTPAPEDLPTQAQVDDAQNKALASHAVLFNEQNGWNKTQEKINAANTTADNGLLQGLKALGRKDLGASLVPFQVPTDQEVKDYNEGKLNYDPWARPEYFKAGHRIGNTSKGYAPGASESQATNSFVGSYVDIIQGTDYKVRFETYAAKSGSRIFWYLYDQDNNPAVEYTDFADSNGVNSFIHGLTLPSGWKVWEGKIRFKPGVRRVSFRQLFWNHPSGVSTTQYLKDLEIVPDVPSQAEVDKLQDEAILKTTEVTGTNTSAIAALQQAVASVADIVSLDEAYKAQQEEIQSEIIKRQELLESIQGLQNQMITRTIVLEGNSTYDDYIDITGSKVTAKSYRGWAGQIVVTVAGGERGRYSGDPDVYRTLIRRYPVPDGLSREWNVKLGLDYVNDVRVDYWVYPGKAVKINASNSGNYISGGSFSSGEWGGLYVHAKFPANNGNTVISWQTELKNADRSTYYELRVLINGSQEFHKWFRGKGPLLPSGSGVDYLNFVWEHPIPQGARVEIQGRTRSSTARQAMVNSNRGTIGYIQPA